MGLGNCFKGRQFTAEVILWAVRWYLTFPVSYRDLELMLLDRGVEVDHTTIFRWIQAYAAELEKRIRTHLRMSNGSWRVDETYVRVRGRWTYLYRAVDSRGQTIDFLLAARRDTAAAKRFFRKAMAQPHVANPRTLTVDKNPAYPRAVADMKSDGQLWRRTHLRQCIWAVRWYLMFPVSYRDLELMLLDRGVEVDHTTIFRWIQAYAAELEKRIRPHLRMSNGSWRVDETYVRVKGRWTYLYRAVDSRGADDRLPSGCAARYGRGQAVLSQGHGTTACRQSANPHCRQESCLS
jgi:transposase-like protein